mgnify:CR=1 FL=1
MDDQTIKVYERSVKERIFHGVLFEVLAIGIATPLASWLTGESLFDMGILSAVISLMAILWNMTFNWLFDTLQRRHQFRRSIGVRVIHACCFELGLIIMAVPFIAWWIDASLVHAFIIDIGLILFFLPYSFFFNLGYDKARVVVIRHRRERLCAEKS